MKTTREIYKERKQNRIWMIISLFIIFCTLALIYQQSKDSQQIKQQMKEISQKNSSFELPQLKGTLNKAQQWSVSRGIQLAREYQIKLNGTLFSNRNDAINLYLNKLNLLLHTNLSINDGEIELRESTLYMAQFACFDPKFQLRLRRYVTGKRKNSTSVDLKYGIEFPPPFKDIEVFGLPFAASKNYSSSDVLSKYETDVHPCKLKISKETRIYNLRFDYQLVFCAQILKLFPDLPINATSIPKQIPRLNQDQIWWNLDFHIKNYQIPTSHYDFQIEMPPLDLEMNFQLGVYESHDEALNGGNLEGSGSEFSFRIWAPGNGFEAYPPPILKFFQYVYEEMLIEFSSFELPCGNRKVDVELGNHNFNKIIDDENNNEKNNKLQHIIY